jgi:hypothetical protein
MLNPWDRAMYQRHPADPCVADERSANSASSQTNQIVMSVRLPPRDTSE